MSINVKEKLIEHKITQKEFAEFIGISRIALNKSLNNSKNPKKGLINNLKMLVAEKKGQKLEIEL
jgi:transcriptional regulator with XRE-family HTH domain